MSALNKVKLLVYDIVRARITKSISNGSLMQDMAATLPAGISNNLADNLLFEVYVDVIHKEYPQYKEMLNSLF